MLNIFRRFPSREWLQEAAATPEFTPDLYRLDRAKFHALFEYGEMKLGMPRHKCIDELPIVMNAFTVERMPMWKTNPGFGTLPIAMKFMPQTVIERPRICGELYRLSRDHILELDKQRQNGVLFDRKRVHLIVPNPDNNEEPNRIDAWMYIGKSQHWVPKIEWDQSFFKGREGSNFSLVKPVRAVQRWLRAYSIFSKQEQMEASNGNKSFLYFSKGLNE